MSIAQPVNVICMKWGTKFTAQDVNILHSMVKRNLTLPHRFVCLTDDAQGLNPGIEHFDLPPIYVPAEKDVSPWRKLGMFSAQIGDLTGKALFLDLDIVIVQNIDCFFNFAGKQFTIIENWTQKGQGIGNSSVYCFTLGQHTEVIEDYVKNTNEITHKFKNEQIYLSRKIGNIKYWPASWCQSFKRQCLPPYILRYFITPRLPIDVKIVVFHGRPGPQEAINGGFFGNWLKYVRPTRWLKDYWY